MDEILNIRVEKEEAGSRLDKFLSGELPELSRSRIQKLLSQGNITRNGQTAKNSEKVVEGDHLMITLPPPEPLDIRPENIPLEIVYEDEDLLVVNKPRGMVVHPAPGHYSGTLVNGLLYHFAGALSGINGVARPGIVHRIDKDTAGLLVVCKTDRAHQGMADRLKVHDIERVYHAIVYGNPKEEEGTIRAPLGRSEQDRKKMAIRPDGRRAVTHWHVLERFGGCTYVEARLETGRTHQIRVHMKSMGHPLLGDPLYGPSGLSGQDKSLLRGISQEDLTGQILVAKVLGFEHPITGEYKHFEIPLPDYFMRILHVLRQNRR